MPDDIPPLGPPPAWLQPQPPNPVAARLCAISEELRDSAKAPRLGLIDELYELSCELQSDGNIRWKAVAENARADAERCTRQFADWIRPLMSPRPGLWHFAGTPHTEDQCTQACWARVETDTGPREMSIGVFVDLALVPPRVRTTTATSPAPGEPHEQDPEPSPRHGDHGTCADCGGEIRFWAGIDILGTLTDLWTHSVRPVDDHEARVGGPA